MVAFKFFTVALTVLLCFLIAQSQATSCAPTLQAELWSTLYGTSNLENINIPSGKTVLLDVSTLGMNGGITIEEGGALYFDWAKNISLSTKYIVIKGSLFIGTENCPFENQVIIQLEDDPSLDGMSLGASNVGRKCIATGQNGVLELHGAKGRSRATSWTHLSQTAQKGDTVLHLADSISVGDASSWKVGDSLVLPSTDYSPDQSEEVTITKILDDKTIEVSPLKYTHYGEISFGVDQRCEVGLLSRNIRIQGDESMGAHIMMTPGTSIGRIEGVEMFLAGQDRLGHYPIHFHMIGAVTSDKFYAKYNSIHNTQFRCITLHAVQGALIDANVAYNATGHCVYLEDGVEMGNVITNNLVVYTRPKLEGIRIGSDGWGGMFSYWITNVNNTFEKNVAAASYNTILVFV